VARGEVGPGAMGARENSPEAEEGDRGVGWEEGARGPDSRRWGECRHDEGRRMALGGSGCSWWELGEEAAQDAGSGRVWQGRGR